MTSLVVDDVALTVDRLSVRFLVGRRRSRSIVHAATDVSLTLRRGRMLALVGESGCGKSVLTSALLGLLPANAQTRGGAVLHTGAGAGGDVELCSASESLLSGHIRGRRIGLVPQSAAGHLTPVRTARSHLAETVRLIGPPGTDVDELAERAGLDPAELDAYPHELSGGMAQRVAFALAMAGDPDVILADEPTTGLDRPLVDHVLGQLSTLAGSGAGDGKAVLLITHDLAAARRVADDIAVMYAGRIVESGPAAAVFADPWHPYTRCLLNALPDGEFVPIPGHPPELTDVPGGCAFCARIEGTELVELSAGFASGPACTGDPELVAVGDRMIAGHVPC
ncbi:peptide ABC transporter ATP-binding protein [Saccharomonospora sp. CUA-673]|uniref:ABC transporter ATP-binding protein n=1 Tax=Saccharomonospora sp. CUA-673 TaxID=1904969 RepID=UPI0009653AA7|nr:ABC transporter ATP-binding protein [Saccharomonospora sp. CUA-673]OLT46619.1 peptide ABC transporter ATP-binding protein [Saccharomonospora sp. CUA-673]